jgi:hypothetical protein
LREENQWLNGLVRNRKKTYHVENLGLNKKNDIKAEFQQCVRTRFDSSGSAEGQMGGFCERGNETVSCVKCWEMYYFSENVSAVRIWMDGRMDGWMDGWKEG